MHRPPGKTRIAPVSSPPPSRQVRIDHARCVCPHTTMSGLAYWRLKAGRHAKTSKGRARLFLGCQSAGLCLRMSGGVRSQLPDKGLICPMGDAIFLGRLCNLCQSTLTASNREVAFVRCFPLLAIDWRHRSCAASIIPMIKVGTLRSIRRVCIQAHGSATARPQTTPFHEAVSQVQYR